MRRDLLLMSIVGITTLIIALSIPSIAHNVFNVNDHQDNTVTTTTTGERYYGGMMGPGMMGDMGMHGEYWGEEAEAQTTPMGDMMGHEDMDSHGPAAGSSYGEEHYENISIIGTVKDKFHMMLEVEAQNGEEVEVMLHHWWKVTLPNGETVEMPGWELVENYIHEGEPIVVQGHEFEGHGHCMGGEESELHLVAYSIELPGQGITATPG